MRRSRPSRTTSHRAGWAAVAAHGVVAGLTQLLWLTYAPVATDAAGRLDVSVATVGWLTNVFPLLYVVLAIPAGLALDRWPQRTMLTGTLLVGVGAVMRVAFGGFGGALLGQMLVSLAQPIFLSGVAVIAAARLPEADRAAGIAVGSAGVFGGLLVGIAMPTLFGGDHLDDLVAAQAALAVVGTVAFLATLRGGASEDAGAGAAPGAGAVLRDLVGDPGQRTLLALAGGGFGTFVALLTWLQALLEPSGIDEDASGILLLLLVLAGLVTTTFLPAFAVRRGREVRLLTLALPTAGVACVVLALGPPMAAVAVALVVIGAVLLPALPVMLELAEQRAGATETRRSEPVDGAGVAGHLSGAAAPTASGAASSLIWLAGNLGGFVMALVVGALLDEPAIAFGLLAAFTFGVAATAGRRLAAP